MPITTLSCARCHKVLPLEVQVDDQMYEPDSPEMVNVSVTVPPGGRLVGICIDCTTPREAHQHMMELAARMLEVNEEYIEQIEGVGAIQPALLDNPQVKASLAQARVRAVEARAQLEALAGIEADLEEPE